jgi:hypothetical protein
MDVLCDIFLQSTGTGLQNQGTGERMHLQSTGEEYLGTGAPKTVESGNTKGACYLNLSFVYEYNS